MAWQGLLKDGDTATHVSQAMDQPMQVDLASNLF
jgi:hypothetical protein